MTRACLCDMAEASGGGENNHPLMMAAMSPHGTKFQFERRAASGSLGSKRAFVAIPTSSVQANSATLSNSGGNTIIQFDVTGDATADFQLELTGLHTLTSIDLLL